MISVFKLKLHTLLAGCLLLATSAVCYAESAFIRGTLIGVSDPDVSVSGCSDQSGVSISTDQQERGGTAILRGYGEFLGHASTPPKRYTQYSLSGVAFSRFYENTNLCAPEGPTPDYPSISTEKGSVEILSVQPNPSTSLASRRYTVRYRMTAISSPEAPVGEYGGGGKAHFRNNVLETNNYGQTRTDTYSLYAAASARIPMRVYKTQDSGSGALTLLASDEIQLPGWCTGNHYIYKGTATFDPDQNKTVSNSLRRDSYKINGLTAYDHTFVGGGSFNAPNHNYAHSDAFIAPSYALLLPTNIAVPSRI